MAAIGTAVTRGREGDTEGARQRLTEIWAAIAETADPFHQCVLAHFLADLHAPAEAIIWDQRALAAADEATRGLAESADEQAVAAAAQLAGFRPSLHLNLADSHRRLGSFATAELHLSTAGQAAECLPVGPYADQIRQWIEQVAGLIARGATERLPTESGTGDG